MCGKCPYLSLSLSNDQYDCFRAFYEQYCMYTLDVRPEVKWSFKLVLAILTDTSCICKVFYFLVFTFFLSLACIRQLYLFLSDTFVSMVTLKHPNHRFHLTRCVKNPQGPLCSMPTWTHSKQPHASVSPLFNKIFLLYFTSKEDAII